MFRALLRGVVTTDAGVVEPFIVFEGGPKSLGDELIVLTSRFFAEPKMPKKENCFRKENIQKVNEEILLIVSEEIICNL
jgi:hypothetical protein